MGRSVRLAVATAMAAAALPIGAAAAAPSQCGRLNPGEFLARGESVASCDGSDLLAHQADGNVVGYQDGDAIWSTETDGDATTTLVMQTDGNLVLYGPGGALWASGTNGNPGAYTELIEGFVFLRAADGRVLTFFPTFSFRP